MICVVGCNHGIQSRHQDADGPFSVLFEDPPEAKCQKSHFARLIDEIIKGRSIQFIGEEWGLQETSIAREVAADAVRWVNINTTLNELTTMGIPTDYTTKGKYTAHQAAQWNREREQVMFRKVQDSRGDARELLVVCGFEHLQPLANLFRTIENCVATIDYREFSWYRAGVFDDHP